MGEKGAGSGLPSSHSFSVDLRGLCGDLSLLCGQKGWPQQHRPKAVYLFKKVYPKERIAETALPRDHKVTFVF